MPGVDAMRATIDELLETLSTKSIIGEPIEMEDKIIIPITKMGMGLCADIGRKGQHASPEDLARCKAGGGVGVFPVAVVIVSKGIAGPKGVKVVVLSPPEEPVSSIAHIVMEKIMSHKEYREERAENMAAIKVE
ncbi:MAG: hypothetical protein JW999_07625 [Methanotrichaceae archaeon]|nr:hypothetical protein [Methanotrichaceae archaeon]